jgi:hypothetical protein
MAGVQDNRLLDHEYARRARNLIGDLVCFRCQRKIRMGSRVHVYRIDHANNPPGHRIYHQRCYDELFI